MRDISHVVDRVARVCPKNAIFHSKDELHWNGARLRHLVACEGESVLRNLLKRYEVGDSICMHQGRCHAGPCQLSLVRVHATRHRAFLSPTFLVSPSRCGLSCRRLLLRPAGRVHSSEGGGVPQHSAHPVLERAVPGRRGAAAAALLRSLAGGQRDAGRPHRPLQAAGVLIS